MVPDDHDICASTNHSHWVFSVHWCPHRQQWSLGRSAWQEVGTVDDPTSYDLETCYLGPFDGVDAVVQRLGDWIDMARRFDWDSPPRLPGS
jgi:hypothetical protein